MNVHCAATYGCVKLIEASLSRPAHRPPAHRFHLADEYQSMVYTYQSKFGESRDTTTGPQIASELRRPWMRWLIAPVSPTPLGRES